MERLTESVFANEALFSVGESRSDSQDNACHGNRDQSTTIGGSDYIGRSSFHFGWYACSPMLRI
jgi:hypothetical protein